MRISDGLVVEDVCRALQMQMPKSIAEIRGKPISFGASGVKYFRKDAVLFALSKSKEDFLCRKANELGASLFVTRRQHYDKNGNPLPCLIVEDPIQAHMEFCAYVRRRFPGKIIAVTGSLGKTMTKDFIQHILSRRFQSAASMRNTFSKQAVSFNVQLIQADLDYFVQEIGAGSPNQVRTGAYITRPHASVITNISEMHTDAYEGIEGVIDDKLNVLRFLQDDGVGFINADDVHLQGIEDSHRIITFGVENEQADYRGTEIELTDGWLQYTLCHGQSRIPIRFRSKGKHNVLNSLAAICVAHWAGIPLDEVAAILEEYQGYENHHNFSRFAGYRFFLDCYNNAPKSVAPALEIFAKMPLDKGRRKIVVLGDFRHLNREYMKKAVDDLTQNLRQSDFDRIYLCGRNNEETYRRLQDSGLPIEYAQDRSRLRARLAEFMQPGDAIMFKGPPELLLSKTVDELFGTAMHFDQGGERRRVTASDMLFQIVQDIEEESEQVQDSGASLLRYNGGGAAVAIPSTVEETEVQAIGSKAFSGNPQIREVMIPDGVYHIGFSAFYHCANLRSVHFPKGLKYIERSAFNHCDRLKQAVLPDGILHIGPLAFYKCRRLDYVRIPDSVQEIAEDAFAGCKGLRIACTKGSFAWEYAMEHHIPVYRKGFFRRVLGTK